MSQRVTIDNADAFMGRFKLLLGGIVAVFVLPLVIYAIYMDRRLDAFEDSLRYQPPQELDSASESESTGRRFVPAALASGQVVYVPAYSHIYHDDGDPYLLTITLSIRNTSTDRPIVVRSVRYFDTKGNEVRSYLQKPVRLPALATTEFLVARDDSKGGSGSNFLVEWHSLEPVTEPIIEAVMIDTSGQQGISFARRGTVVGTADPAQTREGPPVQPVTDASGGE